jgi:hypothetical protein
VERARGGASSGRGTSATDAHWQTHQCRISDGCLDPPYQHHDAGAGPGDDAVCASLAGIIIFPCSECAIAVTTPDSGCSARDCSPCASGGQKAGCAETCAHGRAGSARTRGTGSGSGCSSARSRGGE